MVLASLNARPRAPQRLDGPSALRHNPPMETFINYVAVSYNENPLLTVVFVLLLVSMVYNFAKLCVVFPLWVYHSYKFWKLTR